MGLMNGTSGRQHSLPSDLVPDLMADIVTIGLRRTAFGTLRLKSKGQHDYGDFDQYCTETLSWPNGYNCCCAAWREAFRQIGIDHPEALCP